MKKEKKDWPRVDMASLEEIKTERELQVISLKKEISSLRGQNTRMKKDIERYKALDHEGDELNERRIKEIDDLKKEAQCSLESKQKVIDGLNDQTMELRETISQQESLIKDLRGDLSAYEANTEWFNELPWWRKAFTKL